MSDWGNAQTNTTGAQDAPISVLLAHKDIGRTTAWLSQIENIAADGSIYLIAVGVIFIRIAV